MHERIQIWAELISAMPVPAALVDAEGDVVCGNRWIEVAEGDRLVEPRTDGSEDGWSLGVNGSTRWRLRPLSGGSGVLLATDSENNGDHLLRKFFSSGDLLYVVYDQLGRIVESNDAWQEVLGYSQKVLLGMDSWSLLPPEDLISRSSVEKALREQGRADSAWRMRAADGSYRVIQWALRFDLALGRCFGIGRDVGEDASRSDELYRRAYTDELTGLANRARLVADLDKAIASGLPVAVLFCDLDRFKVVNDSLGHQAGDELLAALGIRLRSLSAGEGTVARVGGDEFVVVVPDAQRDEAVARAEVILAAMREPFTVVDRIVRVGMSIGISTTDRGEVLAAEDLIGRADMAAYRAKKLGRDRHVIFDGAFRAQVDRRFNIESELHVALEQDQFVLHYQPIVSLADRAVVGVEALLRWRDSDGELRYPDMFLDVAEDAGLMPAIGQRVVRRAVKMASRFAQQGRAIPVSVNASASELAADGFVGHLLSTLHEMDFPPALLLVEITESSVLEVESALDVLLHLRDAGVRIALDDFGTGFSSLVHLRTLPIDVVKIDRSFVQDVLVDPVAFSMTQAILNMCAALKLDVVVEGVETPAQAEAMRSIGAVSAQGFWFHRPMPLASFEALMSARPA